VRLECEASRAPPPAECQRIAGESNSPATVPKKSVETDSCKPESSSDDFLPVVAREFNSLAVVRVVSAVPSIELISLALDLGQSTVSHARNIAEVGPSSPESSR